MMLVQKANLLSQLALRDLLYDRKVSFCIIASLIAVIAPLLLLFSLKYGIVSQLRSQLINDPRNLEIKIVGNLNLSSDWFIWLKQQPETRFVMPLTRSLNTIVDLRTDNRRFISDVELLPTESGDPVLGSQQLQQSQGVVLSALAAEKLAVKAGDKVTLLATRKYEGITEKGLIELVIDGVLPESQFSRAAAFVDLTTLVGIEDFRDGLQTDLFPTMQGKIREQVRTTFARARIYASSLEDVAPLALKLRDKHIDTRTEAKAIENVKAIDSVLNVIFMVIAMTSIIGCILSLIGAFLANIDRKRKEIAVLRLLGFQSLGVMGYLVLQAIILSSLAFILSYLFFITGSQLFNQILTSNLADTHFISSLHPLHLVSAFIICFVLAAIVAAIGAMRAIRIQPAESLRDV
ncbi:ABC transporter permease [Pasteurella canis]|uniref:ABC transporter permease n=1 Tax=Pasteurella canis TaxID=753 RepID=A0A379EWN7_9PAST|nr:ABC transporter permease [Pasteurella canis]SUC10544.1 ABC transporter permease [Pasteurella canis]